ncbi:MAG TPA: hypothetical protein V6C97_36215 [Oculatellaceae cyanobacterium]
MSPSLESQEAKPGSSTADSIAHLAHNEIDLLRLSKGSLLAGAKEVADTPAKSGTMALVDFGIGVGLTAITHNRYAGVMVQRALAVGFSTAVLGDLVHGPTAKEAWGAIADAAHHPENLAADAKQLGKALGHTIADGVISSLGCLGGQIGGTKLSKIDNLLTEDARENFLRTGTVEKFHYPEGSEPAFLKDFEESGMRTGRVTADGKSIDVITRDVAFRGNYLNRFRKERALYKLHDLVGFETGSVANAMQIEKVDSGSYKLWVQENLGRSMEDELAAQTGLLKGSARPVGDIGKIYANHLESNAPELSRQLKKTYLERLLAGETDNHLGNIAVQETPTGMTTSSIDAVRAFKGFKTPVWNEVAGRDQVQALYAGKEIDPEDRQNLARFVERFDTFKGRAELGTLNLSRKEVSGYLARAKWFVEHGVFPH